MSMYDYEKLALDAMRKDYSNERKVVVNRGGVSLPMVLFIVFLVLKLTNTIDWSWWWVTAPLWIPIALVLGIILLVIVLAIPFAILNSIIR